MRYVHQATVSWRGVRAAARPVAAHRPAPACSRSTRPTSRSWPTSIAVRPTPCPGAALLFCNSRTRRPFPARAWIEHVTIVCSAQALKTRLTSAMALARRLHAATASPAWPAPGSTRSPSSASLTSTPASEPAAWTRTRTAAASAALASASRVHRDGTRHACCRRQPQAAEAAAA